MTANPFSFPADKSFLSMPFQRTAISFDSFSTVPIRTQACVPEIEHRCLECKTEVSA